ncbi:hypothetical protein [Legionella israelensis]|uniref:Histone-lysine N-methyltransferase, H3 lysine-79 specific n=2 Tax=Legionella israelensis TaxID=454 RepID=A0A0W0W8U5_9GAMM|nr:hypothetical protein [Legionella israelensis]KTD28765.1 hypothetical protein Lisr_0907 [Legionella israelensis]QBS09426.1 hypothetical protein E4T55_05880 [Legionella israelensis]SCX87752.1 Histone methylation protein DOT1 [Legionella israelensis DSM 19235]STX60329.1 putative methyltransferases [Legionella israelensis]
MDNWLYGFIACAVAVTILAYLPRWIRRYRLWRWRNHLSLDLHQRVYQQLYETVNGYALSLEARKANDAMEYVYGEIKFLPFIALLSLVSLNKDTVFYDLGSGTGKAVLACAMVFYPHKCCGIEHFENLYQTACLQQEKLSQLPLYQEKARSIHFYHANFLEFDLTDANVIFINATSFFGETWEKLNERLDSLAHCHTVITTSKPLLSKCYKLVMSTKLEVSWGLVSAYIHKRKSLAKD